MEGSAFFNSVKPYLEEGLISYQCHPVWPNLAIFNYTVKCQFKARWDPVTKACRGLIVDLEDDRVIARPFPKFFGIQELPSLGLKIPNGKPEVTVKLDGSLGISYQTPDGKLHWATRGSFASPQAKIAEELWADRSKVPPDLTLLCEIIHPDTRVVVPYEFADLILIGAIETESGRDLSWDELAALGKDVKLRAVERLPFDLEEAVARAQQIRADSGEGFVLRWPDGFRVKVKAPEYLEVHRAIIGVHSPQGFAEAWEQGRIGKILQMIPDDVELTARAAELDELYRQTLQVCEGFYKDNSRLSQKEYALKVQAQLPKALWPIVFTMKKGQDYKPLVKRVVAEQWAKVLKAS